MSDELERTNEVEITCTRDIEDITAEILEAKRAGGEAILTIGRGLIEAKALLAHGEWLPYVSWRRKNWLRGASARSAGSGSTARRCCAPGAPSRPGTGS